MLIPARIRCHRRKGPDRPGRRSTRPGPARTGSRPVSPAREYAPGHGQGHAPSPRYAAPPPRPHEAGGPGAGTPAGRGARPSLRDVLARRGDPRGGHHRGVPGTAPGSPSCGPRATSTGRVGWSAATVPVSSSQPMPRFRCGRRRHRGDAAEPGGNPSSTGHVWITIWRRSGRDRFRIFSSPGLPTASVLVTGGGAVRVCPGHVRWHDPAYMHSSSTRLVHSPLHS